MLILKKEDNNCRPAEPLPSSQSNHNNSADQGDRQLHKTEYTGRDAAGQHGSGSHFTTDSFNQVMSLIEEAYYEVSLEGHFTYTNDSLVRITGYAREELLDLNYGKIAKNPKEIFACYNRVFRTGIPEKTYSGIFITKDNKEIYVEKSVSLIKDQAGNPVGFRGICRDVTERMQTEARINRQKKHFEALYTNSTDAIVFINREYCIEDINQKFTEILGYEPDEIKGQSFKEKFIPDNDQDMMRLLEATMAGERLQIESTWPDKNSKQLEVIVKGVPVIIDDVVTGAYVIFIDITTRKEYENKLKYLSIHDSLTGVYNRAHFEAEMLRLEESEKDYPIGIIVVDVNKLKDINDTLGHGVGDRTLKACASALDTSIRKTDILARIGGDEFVIILPHTNRVEAQQIRKRINENVSRYRWSYDSVPLSISIGIGEADSINKSLIDVFKQADNEMYMDKAANSADVHQEISRSLTGSLLKGDISSYSQIEKNSVLARELGESINLSECQLNDLMLLAYVYDLGKVGISDDILFKPEKLSDIEWQQVKQHPEIGQRIARSSAYFNHIADLILYHHERWDGKGYPQGLKGDEIPVECRILSIVNAYNSMVNFRPYRQQLSMEEAIKELRKCAGTDFDPHLVEVFISYLGSKEE